MIVATGYRRGLEPLVGHLGLVGAKRQAGGARRPDRSERTGPYFIGFSNPISGNFREIALDSKRIARAISRELAKRPGPVVTAPAAEPVAAG